MKTDPIYEVPLKDIKVSGVNVRLSNPTQDLAGLADSIKQHGLLSPINLRGTPDSQKPYELISGQRRFLAHEQLGRSTIKAIFVDIKESEVLLLSLIENMQRVELDWSDTSKAITGLYLKYGKDERRVCKETNLSLRRVRDAIMIEALATPRMTHLLSLA